MFIGVCAVFLSLIVGVLGLTVEQPELSWTKQKVKRAYIKCKVTGLASSNYVHWYQQKDGEAIRRILYVNAAGTSTVRDPNHPEADDFSVKRENDDTYVLRADTLKMGHSAVYYCACWDSHNDSNYSYPVQKL
ncbi:hypothetical protein SRHO_G00021450 [Serrasalmus rhombeus]